MTIIKITNRGKAVTEGSADDSANESDVIVDGNASNDTKDVRVKAEKDEYRRVVENMYKDIAEIPKNWNDMTVREQRDWMYLQADRHMTNLPRSLRAMWVGSAIEGDCGRPATAPVPDWFDREKFVRGQRFANNNFAAVFVTQLLALIGVFSFDSALKPLIMTGVANTPFTAFKKFMSAATQIRNWYNSDPWTKSTAAYRSIQTVRKMHMLIRNRLIDSSLEDFDAASKIDEPWSTARSALLEDFQGSCPMAAPGQCPYVFGKEDLHKRPKGMNQADMAVSQSTSVSLIILHPEAFGIHGASDEDLEAFCHVWRCVGYLLGMEDEFNFCDGTLEDVRQRSRDFYEYWVKPNFRDVTPEWEHMLRCIMTGIGYSSPLFPYEHGVMYFAELLGIRLPQLEASLSYRSWLQYKLMKITLRWITRLPGIPAAMNRGLIFYMERALRYSAEEHAMLEKQSTLEMSRAIKDNAATSSDLATTIH